MDNYSILPNPFRGCRFEYVGLIIPWGDICTPCTGLIIRAQGGNKIGYNYDPRYQYDHNYTSQKPEIYKNPATYPQQQIDVMSPDFLYHLMMSQRGAGPHIQQQSEVQRPGIYIPPMIPQGGFKINNIQI